MASKQQKIAAWQYPTSFCSWRLLPFQIFHSSVVQLCGCLLEYFLSGTRFESYRTSWTLRAAQQLSSLIVHSSTFGSNLCSLPLNSFSYLALPVPSSTMPLNPKQSKDHQTPVGQMQRLSVIRGPSHPPLMNLTLGELTRRQSLKHEDRVAVISQHQNEAIIYSQLHKYSDDLAAGMIALGIKRGDRVAVMLGNRSEYVYVRRALYYLASSIEAEEY